MRAATWSPSTPAEEGHVPFDEDVETYVVPALNPDVAILHAQRADRHGNIQSWGILGPQQEVAFASKRTIVLVEEIVDDDVIRSDPNRTLIPGFVVDAVVECKYGAHPSFAQGHYDRDNDFYRSWSAISKDPVRLENGSGNGSTTPETTLATSASSATGSSTD